MFNSYTVRYTLKNRLTSIQAAKNPRPDPKRGRKSRQEELRARNQSKEAKKQLRNGYNSKNKAVPKN